MDATLAEALQPPAARRPRLIYFYSQTSGPSRRVEGYLSQVLQRRRNHATFDVVRVGVLAHPELVEKFRIQAVPTILVVDENRVAARLDGPRGRHDIEHTLAPWLH